MKSSRQFLLVFCMLCFVLPVWHVRAQGWLWARGSTGSAIDAWPVATDVYGNVFAAGINFGYSTAVISGQSIPYTSIVGLQCIITKYDASGHLLWTKATQNGNANLIGIATDRQGNSFIYGTIASKSIQFGSYTLNSIYTTAGDAQYFLAKMDQYGNIVWAVSDGNVQSSFASGGGFASILGVGGVATDKQGNIYVTGNFHKRSISIGSHTLTNADPTGNTEDIFVAKYDPQGNVVWATSVGGKQNDDAYGITITPSGSVYIAGEWGSAATPFGASVLNSTAITNGQVAFIGRLDATGAPQWACASGGTGGAYAVGLAADADDNVYLTGGAKDKAISFSGTTIANPAPGKPLLYLVKFDPDNNVSWYKIVNTTSSDPASGAWGYSIALSECGVVWVSGAMVDSVTIDGHMLKKPDNSMNHDTTADPVFIAGYTTAGDYVGSSALISGADDQNGIACDAKGNVYMCADYLGHLIFTAGDVLPRQMATEEAMYLTKYASLNANSIQTKSSTKAICSGTDVTLAAPAGYKKYEWNDGNRAASRVVNDTGTFWVSCATNCTSYSYDTFNLHNCDCQLLLFVPNTFTPNGDGENDVFYPRCSPGVARIASFRVYNRWGVLVFNKENIAVNDAANAWDGYYNGQPPAPEAYVWTVEAVCEGGSVVTKKGSVTIIR